MNRVCGIVVTYNPDAEVPRNLARLRPQVGHMVVIDNGSRVETLVPIRECCRRLDITLLENGVNLGIAAALNRGVCHASALDASLVALFDQDSTADDGLIAALLDTYEETSRTFKVGIVSAKHIHADTKEWMNPVFHRDGGPIMAITSGSLIPLPVLRDCGPFEDGLFMARVDEEYSLRARSRGYTIRHCEAGVLWVTLGTPRPFRLFGRTLFRATHYPPLARYYITRNRLVIVKRFWRLYPLWCYWCVQGMVKEFLFVVLAEDRKAKKCWGMVLGIRDALLGRMGAFTGL